MTAELLELAGRNIEGTYLAVGKHGDGAKIEHCADGLICTSELHHPVSNFAIARRYTPEFAHRLAEIASGRKIFNVYALPGPELFVGKQWSQAGFRVAGCLSLLTCQVEPSKASPTLVRASTFEERQALTRFMAMQFFSRQTSYLRERIALATAKAEVDLYHFGESKTKVAVMVCRSKGMLGVYNLCVASSERDRGYGGDLLNGLSKLAYEEGRVATLQCDPSLEPWYVRRGFVNIGDVGVLTLERKSNHAIL